MRMDCLQKESIMKITIFILAPLIKKQTIPEFYKVRNKNIETIYFSKFDILYDVLIKININ